jgi:hypothetical protein
MYNVQNSDSRIYLHIYSELDSARQILVVFTFQVGLADRSGGAV